MVARTNIVDRLEKGYTSLNPQQRVELELYRLRSRRLDYARKHEDAEDALLWLLKQEGHVNVIANFQHLRRKFNY